MNDFLKKLERNRRRGSKPRCHWLTHGSPEQIASRLTKLIEPWGEVSVYDNWMPQGFENIEEAQLRNASKIFDSKVQKHLLNWWLAADKHNLKTPNFDIASTCNIGGNSGILLVEAKAHDNELIEEEKGKELDNDASNTSKANHNQIGKAIKTACDGLHQATSLDWHISHESHYQMSNRFAWSWKLTEQGFSVILVYLGFLNADEMKDKGNTFTQHEDWDMHVKSHNKPLFPAEVWNQQWTVNEQAFIPLIKSIEQPLNGSKERSVV